jgi:K+-sensing histidine kinase KdpD
VKYADEHSEVTLECGFEIARGTAALKVKSYGEPIYESEKEIIFEMFKRGREIERTGRHHGGVGLGLFVARTLMIAIGGNLTVELSRSDPRRAIFVMHFPG